ncbi:uncharacterized protein LOC118433929 [Folsomia candida]|uniref:uncharacterized protein LOC118433929 n=1 Tax=Folsomia candida TaxID=158441 RepID=UPI001604D168|nr:uncharacterized protein LOC118433929 [Folsomia candida]
MFFYKYCRPFLKARQRFVPSTASSSSSITTPTLTVDSLRAGAKVVHPGVISCFPGKTYTGLDKDEIKEYNRLAHQRSKHIKVSPSTPWVPVLEPKFKKDDGTGIHPSLLSCFSGLKAELDDVQLREYNRLAKQRSRHLKTNPLTPWVPALLRRIYQHKTEFDEKFGKLGILRPGDAPSQKLLEYLGLDPDTRFLSSGM